MMGIVVRGRLRDTWRKPLCWRMRPQLACSLSRCGGSFLTRGTLRESARLVLRSWCLAGFVSSWGPRVGPHAGLQWRGRLGASFSYRGPCCPGGPSSSPEPLAAALPGALCSSLPCQAEPTLGMRLHPILVPERGGVAHWGGTKQRCGLPFVIPLPPFIARSPQGDWGPVSGASSSSSSGLQRFPTPDPGI